MLEETVKPTTLFAESLPVLLGSWSRGWRNQEESLGDLGDSIDHVTEAVPLAVRSASAILRTTRVLLLMVAGMVTLHAAYLLLGIRLGTAYSG